MAKKTTTSKKAAKAPAKKPAPKPAKKAAKKPASKTPAKTEGKKPSGKLLHLHGLEVLADMALKVHVPSPPVGLEAEGAGNVGNMSPAEAVIWALNRAVGPPFGPNDSVSGLGITSNAQWESLANDIHTARNSFNLNGAQTRSKLPAAPGDTVSALVGVVASNS